MNADQVTLREQASLAPERPGVYLFRDHAGQVLYVGKAACLRDRVRSYFRQGLAARTRLMLSRAATLEYIATHSELEALILESNLIKEHRPEFNIRLRDDKHFPFVRVGMADAWPAVSVVRSTRPDGARYFGPYTRAQALAETLRAARRIFPFRTCSDHRLATAQRPCLHHDLGRCQAPCTGRVSREEYLSTLRELCLFLEGRQQHLARRLRERMQRAADSLDFEKAAELRDQLLAVEQVLKRQKMLSPSLGDLDALGIALTGDEACVQVFRVREGKLVGRETYPLRLAGSPRAEVVSAFIKQHYGTGGAYIPPLILVPELPPQGDRELIEQWLEGTRGGRVRLVRPLRGEKRGLVELAAGNASLALEEARAAGDREHGLTAGAVEELGRVLGLEPLPRHIEAFDVSGFHGRETVGSMVTFEDGRPCKEGYRRYRIRGASGRDDYRMLQEILHRRYRKAAVLPDLVVVDGGRGHLVAAREVLDHLGLTALPAIALAKEREEIYTLDRPAPIALEDASPALRLLRRVRDEAHRFAVGYHRRLRKRRSLKSSLDEIPGIGPSRRRALLRHFGSLAALRRATVEELARVPGIGPRLAAELQRHLHADTRSRAPTEE